jgi:hypothetical protein
MIFMLVSCRLVPQRAVEDSHLASGLTPRRWS